MMEKDEFAAVLREVLHEHRQIDDDKHATHHQYIERKMLIDERREAAWMKFKLSFIGTVAIGFVGVLVWIGKLVWAAATHAPG